MNYFTIGEMAKISGFTVKALRFYEKIKLFEPSYINEENQYRYYDESQLPLLEIIKTARLLDVSPNDLVQAFSKKDNQELFELILHYQMMAQDKIRLLERQILISQNIQRLRENSLNSIRNEGVYLLQEPKRNVFTRTIDGATLQKSAGIHFAELERDVYLNAMIPLFETGILIFEEEFGNQYQLFISVLEKKNGHEIYEIPAGKYLCVNYTRDTIQKQQKKLFRYIQKNRVDTGVTLQRDLLLDLFGNEGEKFELQVQIL